MNVGPNLAKSINGNVDDVITFKGYLSDGIIDSCFGNQLLIMRYRTIY